MTSRDRGSDCLIKALIDPRLASASSWFWARKRTTCRNQRSNSRIPSRIAVRGCLGPGIGLRIQRKLARSAQPRGECSCVILEYFAMNTAKTAKPNAAQNWAKPQLVRLGQIADVAGPLTGALQNATKS